MIKKKLKIDFASFWPNFVKHDNYFYHLLRTKYEVEISDQNPDLLFYSVDYGKKLAHFDSKYSNAKKIFYTGENIKPDLNFCDASISFIENFDERNYRLPLWALHINWFNVPHSNKRDQSYLVNRDLLTNKNIKVNKHFCSFVASNESGERINFAKKLDSIKKIDSGGKLLNSTGKFVKGRGDQKWKIKYLSQFRFNIAFENEIGNGYVTEKIFHPMCVNSIPIYWGSDFSTTDFNEESFINVNQFNSFDDAIKKVLDLENNIDQYISMLSQPWFKGNEYPDYVIPENVLNFISSIIES